MGERSLYDRVRAAYGLDDDDAMSMSSLGLGSSHFASPGLRGGTAPPGPPAYPGSSQRPGHHAGQGSHYNDHHTTLSHQGPQGQASMSTWNQNPLAPSQHPPHFDPYAHGPPPGASFSNPYGLPYGPLPGATGATNGANIWSITSPPPGPNAQPTNASASASGLQPPWQQQPVMPSFSSAPPPAPPAIETLPPLANPNSIGVPFDPDDQSDDEVIITSAYDRKVRTGEISDGAASKKISLSPRAKAFAPTSVAPTSVAAAPEPVAPEPVAPAAEPVEPLSFVHGSGGMPNEHARIGQPYPVARASFCPWSLVSNYPDWFVGKQNRDRVKPYFMTEQLVTNTDWDFCYVWLPEDDDTTSKMLGEALASVKPSETPASAVLVPTAQFQHLLARINKTLDIQLTIPTGPAGDKFRVVFGQHKMPVPRHLGRCRNPVALSHLFLHPPPLDPADRIAHRAAQAKKTYLRKVVSLFVRYDRKGEAAKRARQRANQLRRAAGHRTTGRQMKRVQRYLGLRPQGGSAATATATAPGHAVDVFARAPGAFEEDVVIVCMDIECFEFNHTALTEIGFGVLDTRDLVGVVPGEQCANWFDKITARHLRIKENAGLVNRVHVMGNEENFVFGKSEMVRKRDILSAVTRILQPRDPRDAGGKLRNVVLVGHDIKSDIALVAKIGFDCEKATFLEVVDTQAFYAHLRMRSQMAGLRSVLNDLEIAHKYLHNGGNDAVFTLQALLLIVAKKREESLRRQMERHKPGFSVNPEVVAEGWDTGGEQSDGGAPEPDDSLSAKPHADDPKDGRQENTDDPKDERITFKGASATAASLESNDVARLGMNLSALVIDDEDLIKL